MKVASTLAITTAKPPSGEIGRFFQHPGNFTLHPLLILNYNSLDDGDVRINEKIIDVPSTSPLLLPVKLLMSSYPVLQVDGATDSGANIAIITPGKIDKTEAANL